MSFKNNAGIIILILIFILSNLAFLNFYSDVWWDSAVYIGMGKYIYSLGDSGLWENSRQIMWPLILGLLWKIGLNPVIFGRIAEIIFGSLCILLTYLIGLKIFDKKVALLSSIFLAISPTFLFFNGVMLSEIVSTFFSLIAAYFLIKRRYLLCGIAFGISFMTRFIQLFAFIAILLTYLIYSRKNAKTILKLSLGFVIPVMPYLMLNQALYSNLFLPFSQQLFLTRNSGWQNYYSISYYFLELFKESFLYLFVILGIILSFKYKDVNKKYVAMSFIFFIIFFNSVNQKEMRFLIVLLPFMYLLISFSLIYLFNYFKKGIIKKALTAIIIISIALSFSTTYYYFKNEKNKIDTYEIMQEKLQSLDANSKIWISSPVISVLSNIRPDKLMYYPVFNEEKKKEFFNEFKNADFIFIDSCDLGCKPNDINCEDGKRELLSFLKQSFIIIYSSKAEKCEQFIFKQRVTV